MFWFLCGVLVCGALLIAYVRNAPFVDEKWHVQPAKFTAMTQTGVGSYMTVIPVVSRQEALKSLNDIALKTPRTTRVAGSVAAQMVTYETRTLLGFPDYTTVAAGQDETGQDMISVFGRLRFGVGDMGVNKARITQWLAQLPEHTTID